MTQLLDDLRAARELVAAGWCQGESALGKRGNIVSIFDDHAVAFCASGACERAASRRDEMTEHSERLHFALLAVIQVDDVAEWNDAPERTQADVVAAFTAAIQRAEQAERGTRT